MGCIQSAVTPGGPTYLVTINTGDIGGAGTDGTVKVALVGEKGETDMTTIDSPLFDDFERASAREYEVESESDLGELGAIRLSMKEGLTLGADWYVTTVRVRGPDDRQWVFPVYSWVMSGVTKTVLVGTTSTLESTPEWLRGTRASVLEAARAMYGWEDGLKDDDGNLLMPRGMRLPHDRLPRDEKFRDSKDKDFKLAAARGIVNAKLTELSTLGTSWEDFDDLDNLYVVLDKPKVSERWRDDDEYVRQLLAGVHPVWISRATAVPDGMVLDGVELALPEGRSFDEELAAGNIYVMDYRDQESLKLENAGPAAEESKEGLAVGPVGFFIRKEDKDAEVPLRPLCIQIERDGPIFTPADSRLDWYLARFWLGMADAAQHQIASHYLGTHASMEPFAISTHRNLSTMHPVFKLLIPHLKWTIAINALASETLVSPGGVIESIFMLGSNSVPLAMHKYKTWKFEDQNWARDVELRGVADKEALPRYPARDDGEIIYAAITKWVSAYIDLHYESDAAIAGDSELQLWWKEVRERGHEGREFTIIDLATRDELKLIIGNVIWVTSTLHALLNFGQYDYFGYIPNKPLRLCTPPPRAKSEEISDEALEAALMEALPNHDDSVQALSTSSTLSSYSDDEVYLGERPETWFEDEPSTALLRAFQADLKAAEAEIDARNAARSVAYPYCAPSRVPNSIAV
eukprot:PLAT6937.1.p1 GENE.PLAT6937.1~~PLAT6937.1.p1  ORF type:complete len:691 (+),score=362.98 PLAT6937.1:122-2194(+)